MAAGDHKGSLTASANSVTNPLVLSGSVAVAVGDLIYGGLAQQTALTAGGTVTDNLGNTYAYLNAGTDAGTVTLRCFYARVTVAGTLTTINVPATASANDASAIASVIEGPVPVSPLDANPANNTDGTTPYACPDTGTLAQPHEVVMAMCAVAANQSLTASSPGVLCEAVSRANASCAVSVRLVTSTDAVSPDFQSGANAAGVQNTASFKLTSGAAQASGTGSATAVGESIVAAVGAAVGVGNALAELEAAGIAAGTGAATAVGEAIFSTVGSAAGVGAADAVGEEAGGATEAQGETSGAGAAAAVGAATSGATAEASGIGTATGVGLSLPIAPEYVQHKTNAVTGAIAFSVSVTLDAPATAGNRLLLFVATDKAVTSFTTPTGFSIVENEPSLNANVGFALYEKIANGGEETFTAEWSDAVAHWGLISVVEVDNAGNIDDSVIASIADVASEITVGPTAATVDANELAIAFWAVDSHDSVTTFASPSDGFVALEQSELSVGGSVGYQLAARTVFVEGSQPQITLGYSGTDDDQIAVLVTIRPASAVGVGEAAGTGAAAAVGEAFAAGQGAADGTGAAVAIGASTAVADGAAAGTGAAGAVGASFAGAVGAATGSGAAAGVGAATAAAAASASGTGTASGVGSVTAAGVGSSSGAGAAEATGASTAAAVGSAAGIGGASGVGLQIGGDSSGAAVGVGTAVAVGAATAEAEGAADGTGAVSGVGVAIASGVGSSSGAGEASAVSAAFAEAVGAAEGTGEAIGVAFVADASGVGDAIGIGAASAVGSAVAAAIGNAAGIGFATAPSERARRLGTRARTIARGGQIQLATVARRANISTRVRAPNIQRRYG